MSEKKNTEITETGSFAALANMDMLNEAMADDCQGLEFSFDQVKLPAGGTAFEIPSAESEESEMSKDITGVITKITLKKATNASGIAFSQAVFAFEWMLDAQERTAVAAVTESVKGYAANLTMSSLVEDEPLLDPETGEIVEPLK